MRHFGTRFVGYWYRYLMTLFIYKGCKDYDGNFFFVNIFAFLRSGIPNKHFVFLIPGLWIRIRIQRLCGSGFALRIRIPDPDSGARKWRKIITFLVNIIYVYKLLIYLTFKVPFLNLWKNLSAKVLLWIRIRIRIGSGFNDFVDSDPDWAKLLDPDPYPDWINPDPQPCLIP
jgi:hypothetical protein